MRNQTSFKPTIKLTVEDVDKLHSGEMTMQRGQWFQLPWSDTPSRWVGRTPSGSIWAVHTYRNKQGRVVMDGGNRRFAAMCGAEDKRHRREGHGTSTG